MLNPVRRSSSLVRKLYIPSPPLKQRQKPEKKHEDEQQKRPKAQASTSPRKRKTDVAKDSIRHGMSPTVRIRLTDGHDRMATQSNAMN